MSAITIGSNIASTPAMTQLGKAWLSTRTDFDLPSSGLRGYIAQTSTLALTLLSG